MGSTKELLQEFLADYDNCDNIEQLQAYNSERCERREYLLNLLMWSPLIECKFEEKKLKIYFEAVTDNIRFQYITFAVEAMHCFVQANFTGPELPNYLDLLFADKLFVGFDFSKQLSLNNEDINVNTKYPALLCAAICIFKCCDLNESINLWWQWRTLMVHQHILEELSPTLLSEADRIHKEIKELKLEGRIRAKFEIEQAQLYIMFRKISEAEAHLATAQEILGIKYELVGKLGKRTKFQENSIAQLTVDLSFLKKVTVEPVNKLEVPKHLKLQDDVRLETITFNGFVHQEDSIPDLEQKLLLCVVQEMLMSRPHDNLLYEEIRPFLDLILTQNNTWAVRSMVLLVRCKMEYKDKRISEHCFLQSEEISNSIKHSQPDPLIRINGIYSTGFPPIWKTEELFAQLMSYLGLTKAALDIFLKLQLWDEVILSYHLLKMRHKAIEVIKHQLEVKPTVKLWCLLGDATEDVGCYMKAWEMSKKRSSRAQRHWGQFLFDRKQYAACIQHFERSLSINPLQANVWINYGFAALTVENWHTAATAYRRYTTLEPENFEAWNNLAKAYIKIGNKQGAHRALHNAVQCNYENWKIWDNLMVVSADIAHYSDVIYAYHRILDLKEKHLDVEVLQALVFGVIRNATDFEGLPANRLVQKTRQLLGRVTSIFPMEGQVWELYATLAPGLLLKAQRLQRALRGFTQSGWEKDNLKRGQVMYVCIKLAELVLSDEIEPTDSLVNTVRLNLSSSITSMKKEDVESTRMLLAKVEQLLVRVTAKFKSPKAKTES